MTESTSTDQTPEPQPTIGWQVCQRCGAVVALMSVHQTVCAPPTTPEA